MLAAIRAFFAARDVLEVETPMLGSAPTPERHVASLHTRWTHGGGRVLYLQSSPEFAMKRLLAAGSGPIFQLGRAFRDDPASPVHNPEFTLLEWYRPGFDQHRLMDEVVELLVALFDVGEVARVSFAALLDAEVGVDPFAAPDHRLRERCAALGLRGEVSRGACLDFLLDRAVRAGYAERPVLVHDFPAGQASLARGLERDPARAERFELFYRGIEIANGYRELGDPVEQRRRFEADLAAREANGRPPVPLDERLLAALASGLPDCAGVALGVDRVLMAGWGEPELDRVMAFPVARA